MAQFPQTVKIELFDSSLMKFPVSSATTPRNLIALVCRKVKVLQLEYFGLSYSRSGNEDPPSVSDSQLGPDGLEDRVFLLDDIPIHSQIDRLPNDRVWMSLKYGYDNAHKDFEDQNSIVLVYREMRERFLNARWEGGYLGRDKIV